MSIYTPSLRCRNIDDVGEGQSVADAADDDVSDFLLLARTFKGPLPLALSRLSPTIRAGCYI